MYFSQTVLAWWSAGTAISWLSARRGHLAQLVRALHSHCRGHWFEPSSGYQSTLQYCEITGLGFLFCDYVAW